MSPTRNRQNIPLSSHEPARRGLVEECRWRIRLRCGAPRGDDGGGDAAPLRDVLPLSSAQCRVASVSTGDPLVSTDREPDRRPLTFVAAAMKRSSAFSSLPRFFAPSKRLNGKRRWQTFPVLAILPTLTWPGPGRGRRPVHEDCTQPVGVELAALFGMPEPMIQPEWRSRHRSINCDGQACASLVTIHVPGGAEQDTMRSHSGKGAYWQPPRTQESSRFLARGGQTLRHP